MSPLTQGLNYRSACDQVMQKNRTRKQNRAYLMKRLMLYTTRPCLRQ